MNDTIVSLIKLQEMDLALESLRRAKAALEPRRAALRSDLQGLLSAFEESKKSIAEALLKKKSLEGEAEAKEQAARKHTAELNAVKSNDAYKALLTEIENAKQEKAAIEDSILEVMELQDKLQKDLKEREKTLASDKAALEGKIADADAEEKALDAQTAAKGAEREAFFQTISEDARRPYEAVRRGRTSFAVLSEIKGMICGGCRTTLPPDVVNQVMKGKEIVTCDSCSRIFYIVPAQTATK